MPSPSQSMSPSILASSRQIRKDSNKPTACLSQSPMPASSPSPSRSPSQSQSRVATPSSSPSPSCPASPSSEPEPEPWEEEFSSFPEHLKFFKKLRTAQSQANKSGKRAQICWRTHRTSLGPKPCNGKLEKIDYISKLISALKNVRTPAKGEKEVIHIYNVFNVFMSTHCTLFPQYISTVLEPLHSKLNFAKKISKQNQDTKGKGGASKFIPPRRINKLIVSKTLFLKKTIIHIKHYFYLLLQQKETIIHIKQYFYLLLQKKEGTLSAKRVSCSKSVSVPVGASSPTPPSPSGSSAPKSVSVPVRASSITSPSPSGSSSGKKKSSHSSKSSSGKFKH